MDETGKFIEGSIPHPVEGEDLTNSLLLSYDEVLTREDISDGISFMEEAPISDTGRIFHLYLMGIARSVAGCPAGIDFGFPFTVLKGNHYFVHGLCITDERNEIFTFEGMLDVKARTGFIMITGVSG